MPKEPRDKGEGKERGGKGTGWFSVSVKGDSGKGTGWFSGGSAGKLEVFLLEKTF